ncbi:hypothetical protein BGZ68_005105, partial [Mortierella alpina]
MSAPLIDAIVKAEATEQRQMPKVFELYSDKMVVVREAAEVASKAIMALPTRYAVRLLLPVIFHAIKESK